MTEYYNERDIKDDSGLADFAKGILAEDNQLQQRFVRDPARPTARELAVVLNAYYERVAAIRGSTVKKFST